MAQFPASVRAFFGGKQHGVKARVSYDQKTNALLAKIVKARIDDLDIHFPGFPLDCRISVNLEMDWPGDVEELEQLAAGSTREQQPDRHKDRLSYTQSYYQIDLTQVTQTMRGVNVSLVLSWSLTKSHANPGRHRTHNVSTRSTSLRSSSIQPRSWSRATGS